MVKVSVAASGRIQWQFLLKSNNEDPTKYMIGNFFQCQLTVCLAMYIRNKVEIVDRNKKRTWKSQLPTMNGKLASQYPRTSCEL